MSRAGTSTTAPNSTSPTTCTYGHPITWVETTRSPRLTLGLCDCLNGVIAFVWRYQDAPLAWPPLKIEQNATAVALGRVLRDVLQEREVEALRLAMAEQRAERRERRTAA